MSETYHFNDGEWEYTFQFYKYNTIHVTMVGEHPSNWHDWHVWYNKKDGCDWTNVYSKDLMSDAAKEFGNRLIKMRLFL